MRIFSIIAATLLVLATWTAMPIQAECTDYTTTPGGPWATTCGGCTWSSSTWSCPNDPGSACTVTNGCQEDDQQTCQTATIDIARCATCDLRNIDGVLACDSLLIITTATVAVDNNGATFSYAHDQANSSPIVGDQYSITTGTPYGVNVKNDQTATIVYNFSLPGGWSLMPQDLEAINLEWSQNMQPTVSGTQITVVDSGDSNNTYPFTFAITDGTTVIESPDPTIITKSDP